MILASPDTERYLVLFLQMSDRAAYHEHRRDLRRYPRLGVLIWAFGYSVVIGLVL